MELGGGEGWSWEGERVGSRRSWEGEGGQWRRRGSGAGEGVGQRRKREKGELGYKICLHTS